MAQTSWKALVQRQPLERSQSAALWKQAGIRDARRAELILRSLCNDTGARDTFEVIIDTVFATLTLAPDSDDTLNQFERITAAVPSKTTLYRNLAYFPPAIDLLLRIASHSQYLTDIVVRDVGVLELLFDLDALKRIKTRDAFELALQAQLKLHDTLEGKLNALRYGKRRELFRIALADIAEMTDFWDCVAQLSDLAEATIAMALALAWEQLLPLYGRPGASYCVLGMGKLGGSELNYSSDVDLVVIYEKEGETLGGRESLSHGQFFSKLVEKMIQALTLPTEQGRVLRVDMDLRPWGNKSDLALSLESFYVYWDRYIEPWERQAYLKARPIAGDLTFGAALLLQLKPRIYLDPMPAPMIAALQAVKLQVESHSRDTGGGRINVKTDPGGIRDIEFPVQLLQLVFGAAYPALQVCGMRAAVTQLAQVGLISAEEQQALLELYVFLRRVEHILQIMTNQQLYHLPVQRTARDQVGMRLGFSRGSFDAIYHQKSVQARKLFQELFFRRVRDRHSQGESLSEWFAADSVPASNLRHWLKPYGFHDVLTAFKNLKGIRGTEARSQQAFGAISVSLLLACKDAVDPDQALCALESLVNAYGQRTAFLQMLGASPQALTFLMHFLGLGPFFSRWLIGSPEWLDLFSKPEWVEVPVTSESLQAELAAVLDETQFMTRLRRIKQREMLKIGIRQYSRRIDWQNLFMELAELADGLLLAAAQFACRKLGMPDYGEQLGMVAMGKWGCREPGFFSDLDLFVLYRAGSQDAAEQQTQVDRWVAYVYKLVGETTDEGRVYELDSQIRPEGSKGLLGTEVHRFEQYLSDRAEVWEWQSLLRARVIGHCRWATAVLTQARRSFTYHPAQRQRLWAEIKLMKQRIQTERVPAAEKNTHFKLGKGGLVTIEFLIQARQLLESDAGRMGRTLAQTVDDLVLDGLLEPRTASDIKNNYLWLRRAIQNLRFLAPQQPSSLPKDKALRLKLARVMGYPSVALFEKDYKKLQKQNEQLFADYFPKG